MHFHNLRAFYRVSQTLILLIMMRKIFFVSQGDSAFNYSHTSAFVIQATFNEAVSVIRQSSAREK